MNKVDISNPSALREAGIQALSDALGPVGMVLFLQQFEKGSGDYTKERHQWLDGLDMETVLRQIRARQNPAPDSETSS